MDKIQILHMINHMERNSKKPLPADIAVKRLELENTNEKAVAQK